MLVHGGRVPARTQRAAKEMKHILTLAARLGIYYWPIYIHKFILMQQSRENWRFSSLNLWTAFSRPIIFLPVCFCVRESTFPPYWTINALNRFLLCFCSLAKENVLHFNQKKGRWMKTLFAPPPTNSKISPDNSQVKKQLHLWSKGSSAITLFLSSPV